MTYRRKEIIGPHTLYLGDALQIVSMLEGVDAVVSDPPYGMKWNTDTSRFSGGHRQSVMRRGQGRSDWGNVENDDKPFDPTPWSHYREVILWGANHFGSRLPVGTTLVWVKRLDAAFGSFLSDAEVAWEKGGHGVYCWRDTSLYADAKHRVHPTQKPLDLMRWCVERTKARTILDPFMGSGTTLVACQRLGRVGIGIEIKEDHFSTACRRVEEAMKQGDLFVQTPERQPVQEVLL